MARAYGARRRKNAEMSQLNEPSEMRGCFVCVYCGKDIREGDEELYGSQHFHRGSCFYEGKRAMHTVSEGKVHFH